MRREVDLTIIVTGRKIRVMTLLIGNPGQRIDERDGPVKSFEFEFSADAFMVGTDLPARYLFEIPVGAISWQRLSTTLAGFAMLFNQLFQTPLLDWLFRIEILAANLRHWSLHPSMLCGTKYGTSLYFTMI